MDRRCTDGARTVGQGRFGTWIRRPQRRVGSRPPPGAHTITGRGVAGPRRYPGLVTTLGVDTTVLIVGGAVVLAAVVFLAIVLAPWKSVRNEPPLDPDIETRLLLGEDPAQVAADADAAESANAPVHVLDPNRADDEDAGLDDRSDLD